MAKDLGKTSTGIEPNVAALLSYVAGWITGLIFLLIEKDNKFVRFHAMQSIILFGALTVVWIILSVLSAIFLFTRLYFFFPLFRLIGILLWLFSLVFWVVLMVKAFQGEKFKLPIAGDIADKKA
jgi:uncharacterized membrane protein